MQLGWVQRIGRRVDAAQRSILFWDVMRKRSNQYGAHLAETVPQVLDYGFELIVDGRQLKRPVNFLRRHMDFIRQWPTAYAVYSRGALSEEVREIWEQSKQRALRIVLQYFEIPQPTRRHLALARAWLALFDELVLAWLQESTIGKDSVIQVSVDTFRDVISRADLLDRRGG